MLQLRLKTKNDAVNDSKNDMIFFSSSIKYGENKLSILL